MSLKDSNEKFVSGDKIENDELDALIEMYNHLSIYLAIAGPEFGLASAEANRRLMRLRDFKNAREQHS